MYFYALVGAVLLSIVSCQRFQRSTCTKSTMCPSGSACVKGICVDCTCEKLRCLINVEICNALNCSADEECYLEHQVNYATRTATVHPACQKRNTCASITCQNSEECQVFYCGDQQPVGRCLSRTADPCTNIKCPTNYYCQANNAYCSAVPCKTDAACADVSACWSCSYQQHCELQEQHDNTFTGHLFKGVCATNNGNPPYFSGDQNPGLDGPGGRPGGPGGPGGRPGGPGGSDGSDGPRGSGGRPNRRPNRRF